MSRACAHKSKSMSKGWQAAPFGSRYFATLMRLLGLLPAAYQFLKSNLDCQPSAAPSEPKAATSEQARFFGERCRYERRGPSARLQGYSHKSGNAGFSISI
jgi:hypothetical protein